MPRQIRDRRDKRILLVSLLAALLLLAVVGVLIFQPWESQGSKSRHNHYQVGPRANRSIAAPREAPRPTPPSPKPNPDPDQNRPGRTTISRTQESPPAVEQSAPYSIQVSGHTKFQRRLAVGDGLAQALRDMESGEVKPQAIAKAVTEVTKELLAVDQVYIDQEKKVAFGRGNFVDEMHAAMTAVAAARDWHGTGEDPNKETIRSYLKPLTSPNRGLTGFKLTATGDTKEPLGDDSLIRVWYRSGAGISKDALGNAQRTISKILNEIDADHKPGFDVIYDPNLAVSLWGAIKGSPQAAGLYVIPDQFGIVLSSLNEEYTPEVLKHELIHAITYQRGPNNSFETSRFVSEGLAEYLRKLLPSDNGLEVPPDRFKNEFALLLQIVRQREAEGWKFDRLDLSRFAQVEPAEFYQYGYFGYLVAQAAMAQIGGSRIHRAIAKERNDTRLVRDLRTNSWVKLISFVERHSAGGDPRKAIVIEDGSVTGIDLSNTFNNLTRFSGSVGLSTPSGQYGRSRSTSTLHGMLNQIGIQSETGEHESASSARNFFSGGSAPAIDSLEAISELLRILKQTKQPNIYTETDQYTMHANFQVARWSSELLAGFDPEKLRSNSPVRFIEALGEQIAGVTHLVTANLKAYNLSESLPTELVLPINPNNGKFSITNQWDKRKRGSRPGKTFTLIFVAGRDEELRRDALKDMGRLLLENQRATWSRLTREQQEQVVEDNMRLIYADFLVRNDISPESVLVIDLGAGSGDARVLAEAFSMIMPRGAKIALWDPQRDPIDHR